MGKPEVDYSLYLVTDSTAPILRGRNLCKVVQDAVEGGVTIVQYRDKDSDTADLIQTAQELHAITKAANVPLLINDRVDVALAVGAEGLHIGQDDLSITVARKILGDSAIIGVTASSVEEAEAAVDAGADYLGIGTVFATPTKENTKSIIAPAGVREILNSPRIVNSNTKTVCIGGINSTNIQRVLFQTQVSGSIKESKALDGVAVVSSIIAADDPKAAAQELRQLASNPPPFARQHADQENRAQANVDSFVSTSVPPITKLLGEKNPVCHNMTNLVVQNLAANVALCVGASPIMSNDGLEAGDLARLGGSLVVNMGTVTPDGLKNHILAIKAYNDVGGPVILDPVGAGATGPRRDAVRQLMRSGYFDLIKGNEGEIKTIAGGGEVQQRGVDAGPGTLSLQDKVQLVQHLAATERNVVLMTGATDVVSNGFVTYVVRNGHELLGAITGSGCTLGTAAASYLAAHREHPLLAVLAAILHLEIAAERAARSERVRGPGSFVPAWLDELHAIRLESAREDHGWVGEARVEVVIAGDLV